LIPITLIVSKATRESKNLEVTKVWKEFSKLIEKMELIPVNKTSHKDSESTAIMIPSLKNQKLFFK